jgi:hypothetical protein
MPETCFLPPSPSPHSLFLGPRGEKLLVQAVAQDIIVTAGGGGRGLREPPGSQHYGLCLPLPSPPLRALIAGSHCTHLQHQQKQCLSLGPSQLPAPDIMIEGLWKSQEPRESSSFVNILTVEVEGGGVEDGRGRDVLFHPTPPSSAITSFLVSPSYPLTPSSLFVNLIKARGCGGGQRGFGWSP